MAAPLLFASGGYVRGPGTTTSDSIPARLSNREFVQPARATAYYGVRVMEALRRMEIPRDVFASLSLAALTTPPIRSLESVGVPNIQRFAEGGLVSAAASAPVAASRVTLARDDMLTVNLRHSPDAIAEFIQSTRGVRVLTETMYKHSPQFKPVLR
jgi:hypothetical protein